MAPIANSLQKTFPDVTGSLIGAISTLDPVGYINLFAKDSIKQVDDLLRKTVVPSRLFLNEFEVIKAVVGARLLLITAVSLRLHDAVLIHRAQKIASCVSVSRKGTYELRRLYIPNIRSLR